MELTKEQLSKIDKYIFSCGIKHYEVRAEIIITIVCDRKVLSRV